MARPKKVKGTFSKIPEIIRDKGRVAGFEAMRDFVLDNWDTLKDYGNPYSMLKMALETDRHALFAEVAELRKQGKVEQELAQELSDYLKGNVDASPDATGERVVIPSFGSDSGASDTDAMDSINEEED